MAQEQTGNKRLEKFCGETIYLAEIPAFFVMLREGGASTSFSD
jgi:hypothetical protein